MNYGWHKNNANEYYLKLDGYYYCNRKKCTLVVLRVRNKRITDTIHIFKIVNDKNYLKEINPFHAFIIGILANNERNGLIDTKCIGLKNMNRIKDCYCNIKSPAPLEVYGSYIDNNNNKITVLKSKLLGKTIEMLTTELYKNQHLLYSLDSLQAVSIGYEASEEIIKNL